MRRSGWTWTGGVTLGGLLALLSLTPGKVGAQLPVEVWARPLIAMPIGDFASRGSGLGASAAAGYDAGVALALGGFSIYGEYQEIAFGCDECADVELEGSVLDRGWGAGVRLPLFSLVAGFRPWGSLGVIGHHLRFRFGEESAYSGASLGWSAGLGAETRPFRWLRIEPSLLVRGYDADFSFAIDVPDRDVSVTYVALGLGIGVGL